MFVIVYQNSVILGPMRWNKFRFQNEIREELEIEVDLPSKNDNNQPILIDQNLRILPVVGTPDPSFNPRTQFLNGPFWTFTDTEATSAYVPEYKSIDAVKNQMKSEVAAERYKKEISGVKVTIQNNEVTVETDRETRNVFVQKFTLMSDNETVNWKFPETWLTLTKSELGQIVSSGAQHIQDQFDWEMLKTQEIESCSTLPELDAVIITS